MMAHTTILRALASFSWVFLGSEHFPYHKMDTRDANGVQSQWKGIFYLMHAIYLYFLDSNKVN